MTHADRDGRFCFDATLVGDTVLVLRVGFTPLRRVVVEGDSLVLTLRPVGTLGPRGVAPQPR
jgi:hypothetical protein